MMDDTSLPSSQSRFDPEYPLPDHSVDSDDQLPEPSQQRGILGLRTAVALLALVASLAFLTDAQAGWQRSLNTWYGPGLYGNLTACGKTLTPKIRGVAHRTLPCGTRLSFRKGDRLVRVRVIDRGPFSAALFDLTARTAQDLCGCRKPYTTTHHWRRGW